MEKAKKARERDCYIKPIKAWKLMKAADEENMTTYIYGVTGSGKTSLVKHYMIRQKETYDLFDAETLRAEELKLPSAPEHFIQYLEEDNRPQIALDVNYENGMGISVGRLREDTVYDWKFVGLSHNTVRGAAGGAVLCAELLKAQGYITAK